MDDLAISYQQEEFVAGEGARALAELFFRPVRIRG
jgi:hypothetical protein